jgi:prepilin-type N-terminal cleavage/methylation domain-containing protein
MRKSAREPGFTLLEFVVVLSVLVALSAMLLPALGGVFDGSRSAAVLELVETLEEGCARLYRDSGRFGHEYTGASYAAPLHHELSREQEYEGWKGPYLAEPLAPGDNPWGGSIHLYNNLLVNGATGWDLDQNGQAERASQEKSCVLWMTEVPEDSARDVDRKVDPPTEPTVDWRGAGRVQWREGTLWVLVYRE